MTNYLKKDTLVEYKLDIDDNGIHKIFHGHGVIKGVATIELPVIGISYILEDISGNLPNELYSFKFFVLPELYFEVIEI
jgi:hypothetical protein